MARIPKPSRQARKRPKRLTDEVAVMIDARDPLEIDKAAEAVEVAAYADSWKTP